MLETNLSKPTVKLLYNKIVVCSFLVTEIETARYDNIAWDRQYLAQK